MWTRQHRKRNTGRLIVPAISIALISYFGFHAYHGEFGIYSRYRLEERTVELQAQLDELRAQRVHLEKRVQLLQDGSIEKDMLDEQARKALNVSLADELTIMRKRPAAN